MRDDIESLAQTLSEVGRHRTYGYCRISSSKQEQGLSLPAQEEAIRQYCRAKGLGDPFIVTETSTAGQRMFRLPALSAPLDEDEEPAQGPCRPRLLMLLGHITTVRHASLVVWRLDRLARINDEREVLYQLMLRSGVRLHTTDRGEQAWLANGDPNDPTTALMRQIFGAFSQYEKAVIEIRMQAGMRFKAAKGGYTGGRVPFGYRSVDRELVVDAQQAALVRYIYMLKHKYKMTLQGISDQLLNFTGQKFPKSRIHRILNTEALYRGQYTDRYGIQHERPDLIILPDRPDYDYEEEYHNEQPLVG